MFPVSFLPILLCFFVILINLNRIDLICTYNPASLVALIAGTPAVTNWLPAFVSTRAPHCPQILIFLTEDKEPHRCSNVYLSFGGDCFL